MTSSINGIAILSSKGAKYPVIVCALTKAADSKKTKSYLLYSVIYLMLISLFARATSTNGGLALVL
jgi:hypothetical protein